MQVEVLEAVFEEAQRKLFSGEYARRKSGDFMVNGTWWYFQRVSADEVRIKVGDKFEDCPRID